MNNVVDILNLVGQVVEVPHFMEHGRRHFADKPVNMFSANIDLPVYFSTGLPNFIYATSSIGPTPTARQYGDGRAGKLVVVKVMVEKVEHDFGLGYDFKYAQHLTSYGHPHIQYGLLKSRQLGH